jgi:hypothetical protein
MDELIALGKAITAAIIILSTLYILYIFDTPDERKK